MAPIPGTLTPYPLAMVICDGIWKDPYTGKMTLIGTFSSLSGSDFPLTHPILSVYVSLTDGRGKMPIKLELVDVNEEREPIFSLVDDFELPDPRVVGEFVFQLAGVVFPLPGEYRLQLFVNTEFIIERRIAVIKTKQEGASIE